MKTDFDIQKINPNIVDAYIRPNAERFENPKFNLSMVNLTWNTLSFEDNLLIIQLNFNNPILVSTESSQDVLVFHIKERNDFFVSKEYNTVLSSNSTTLLTKV
jgi:hypothetical protein